MNTYDPNKYDIVFAGINLNEGVADGTVLTIAPVGPGFTSKAGVDGRVTRTRKHDRRYTAKISLMQTSAVNDRLSALYQADRNAENGRGVGAFFVQDRAGTTRFTGAKAYLAQDPEIVIDPEATAREWLIEISVGQVTHGSNPDD